MKFIWLKKNTKFIRTLLFTVLILIFCSYFFCYVFGIILDNIYAKRTNLGDFALKIETTNQTNQLITAEVIEEGLKKVLLNSQLEPEHWTVDQVYITGIIGSGFADWNKTVQVTNNARVILSLTNTAPAVLKGERKPKGWWKIYCDIRFSDEDQALNYLLRSPM